MLPKGADTTMSITGLLLLFLTIPRMGTGDIILEETHRLSCKNLHAWKRGEPVTYSRKRVVKIQRAGYSSHRHVFIADDADRVRVKYAKLTYQDGTQVRLPTKLFPAPEDLSVRAFGFNPDLVLVVPGLRDGCILEYTVLKEWVHREHLSVSIPLQSIDAIQNLKVDIALPKQVSVDYTGVELESEPNGNSKSFHLNLHSIDPLNPEPAAPPIRDQLPELHFRASFPTKNTSHLVGPEERLRFLGARLESRKSGFTLDTLRKARKLTEGLTQDMDKIDAVYAFVVEEIRDETIRGDRLLSMDSAVRQTLADPWQKTALLQTFLDFCKIQFQVAFFQPHQLGRIHADNLAFARLLPCLWIPQLDLVLAPYFGIANPQLLPKPMLGTTLFFPGESTPSKNLPLSNHPPSTTEERIDIRVGSGHLAVSQRVTFRGLIHAELENVLDRMTTPELHAFVHSHLASHLPNLDLIRVSYEPGDASALVLEYTCHSTPTIDSEAAVIVPMAFSLLRNYHHLMKTDTRQHPFLLMEEEIHDISWDFHSKDNLDFICSEEKQHFENLFGQTSLEFEKGKSTLTISAHWVQNAVQEDATHVEAFNAFLSAFSANPRPIIVVPAIENTQAGD